MVWGGVFVPQFLGNASVLVWFPPNKTRIWVRVVYLRDDSRKHERGTGKKEITKKVLSRWLLDKGSSIKPGSLRNIQNFPPELPNPKTELEHLAMVLAPTG